jgi:hypothetical protein
MNAGELILDADADTSITADTDDQIDIRIAGADDFQFTANTFTAQSGSTIAAQAITATTVSPSGQLINSAGTAGAPSITFTGNLDKGFYDAGTNLLGLAHAGSETFRWDMNNAQAYINETANANSTQGLTINQAGSDIQIITLKSSDVAHGLTSLTETDTYGAFKKYYGPGGGLSIEGYTDGSAQAIQILAYGYTNNTATPNTGAKAGIHNFLAKHDNADTIADMNANEVVWSIAARVGGADRTIVIFDEDGDLHLDGSSNDTVFDEEDDAMLCRSLDLMRSPNKTIRTTFDQWTQNHKTTLEDAGIISKIDPDNPDHWEEGKLHDPMINITQLQRLHNGAIWQQRAMFETMKQVAEEMLPGFGTRLNERLSEQKLPALPVPA